MRLIILTVLLSGPVGANQQETDDALVKTQEAMSKPGFAREAEKMSPQAQKAVQNVRTVTGGNAQMEQAVWQVAAEIFGNMKGKSPEEMQAALAEAQRNPQAFANSLTPEQKRKIEDIAKQLQPSSTPQR